MRRIKRDGSQYWQRVSKSTDPCGVFRSLLRSPPYTTIVFLLACHVLYWLDDAGMAGRMVYGGHSSYAGHTSQWYAPFTYNFMHNSNSHIAYNTGLLVVAGLLLEATETHFCILYVMYGSGILGAGGHGLFANTPTAGASAVAYGILWSQVGLLILNFKEVTERWLRLIILLSLAGLEMFVYLYAFSETSSYGSHLVGAIAGIAVGIVSGGNVVLLPHELYLNMLGVTVYVGLTILMFSTRQINVGCWALFLVPFLALELFSHLRRARRRKWVIEPGHGEGSGLEAAKELSSSVRKSAAAYIEKKRSSRGSVGSKGSSRGSMGSKRSSRGSIGSQRTGSSRGSAQYAASPGDATEGGEGTNGPQDCAAVVTFAPDLELGVASIE